ncbi:MAG: hypothetical protein IJR29_13410 [Butyrivibrio sp.]|nr:hypothetical protein [Butyrivibrio sp.]
MFLVRKMYKNYRNERGSLSVDTIIFLSMFLVFFVFMINIMKLVIIQSVLQFALNQTAKEISQYSYIIAKAGLEDNITKNATNSATMKKNTKGAIVSVSDAVSSYQELFGSIGAFKNSRPTEAYGNAVNVYNNFQNAATKTQKAQETVDSYISYLQESGMEDGISLIKDLATQKSAALLSGAVVKNRVALHVNTLVPGGNADRLLENMGVVEGIDGISCWDSSFYSDGSKDLNLVMSYDIKYHMPFFDVNTYEITLRASTGLW